MSDINRVVFSGRVAQDARFFERDEHKVCSFNVVSNHKYYSASGELVDTPTYLECSLFGGTAQKLYPYIKKGVAVVVDGHLRNNRWSDDEGNTHQKLALVVENFNFTNTRARADAAAPQEAGEAEHVVELADYDFAF